MKVEAPGGGLARGFTLIEVMVVLVLVTIIGIGSYALLDTFNNTDRLLELRTEEMRRLSMAMYRIDDDLRQLTARPVKNAYSGYEPALRGESGYLEFTRLGAANLTGEPRGDLQRLSYSLGYLEGENSLEDDDGALLLRSRWRVLDRAPDSEPVAEPLLAGVDDLMLRYYDADTKAWLAQWPPASSGATTGFADTRLPQAIELVLLARNGGELRRIFLLPKGAVAGASSSGTGHGGSDEGDDNSSDKGDDNGSGDGSDNGSGQQDGEGGREEDGGGRPDA